MSGSDDIEEIIEEEDIAEDGDYENDFELQEETDIEAEIAGSLTESERAALCGNLHHNKTEHVLVSMEVIDNFSSALARTVVEEAMLINEIHERDKLNTTDEVCVVGKPVVTNGGGVVPNCKLEGNSDSTSSGYDHYLMQKLLRSEADPNEATIVENFEETTQPLTTDDVHPGLDTSDRYVKELERECVEINDQNNNEVPDSELPNEESGRDTVLQTIHEDAELHFNTNEDTRDSKHEESSPRETAEIVQGNETETAPKSAPEPEHEKSIRFDVETDGQETAMTERTYGYTETCGGKTASILYSDEETDEEPDCCEMTHRQKKAVVLAVRDGDIDLVELLLEKRHAHIDMLWYGETLLMVAIRMLQEQMAMFLVDNDIDLEFEKRITEKNNDGIVTVYKQTARQMAFDRGLADLVELIDYKTNNLFPFVTPKQREIRIRRPRPPTPPTPEPESEEEDDDDTSRHADDEGGETERSTLGGQEGGRRRKKSSKDKDNDSGINNNGKHGEGECGKSMSTYSDEDSVRSSENKQKSVSNKSKSHCGSHDDLSQVFGPDEGYETMSPISPVCGPTYHRLEQNIVGTRDYVSVRGTKASHLMRAHTSASKRTVSVSSDVTNNNSNVGSYGFERRKWTYCKSAPSPKNYSTESIPDTVVRYGLPFIHGSNRIASQSANPAKRSQNSRNNSRRSSPFDEVAKVLSDSRLLSPTSKSMFPSLSEKSTVFRENHPRNLNINYIYANRGSANSSKSVPTVQTTTFLHRERSDLLPKRKLKV